MVNVDLRHLRYLVAVAEEGGITRAAASLGMTQPALSRAVATLERAIGVSLVERRPRGTVLTAAGEVLAERARALDRDLTAAVRQTREAADDRAAIRVSARSCELEDLYDLIGGYTSAFPERGVEAVRVNWRVQLDTLRAGETELALMSGEFEPDGLDSVQLTTHDRVVVLPAGHRLGGRPVVERAELRDDPVIGWVGSTPAEREYWLDGAPIAGPEVEDMLDLLVQVRLGGGIAFVPESMLAGVPLLPRVTVARVEGLPPARIRLVWTAEQTSPSVAHFVRHVTPA